MKSVGVVRRVDELGRVVLPIELRRKLGIEIKDALEFYIENDNIVMKKYEPSCVFCGEAKDVFSFNGKIVCPKCAQELQKFI